MKFLLLISLLSFSLTALANGVGSHVDDSVSGPETTDIMGYGTPGGTGLENPVQEEKEKQLMRRQQRMEAEEDRTEEIKEVEETHPKRKK